MTALTAADIGTVKASDVPERFLGKLSIKSKSAQAAPEKYFGIGVFAHNIDIVGWRTMSLRTIRHVLGHDAMAA